MSALYTALLEGETKESLAAMVCDLREQLYRRFSSAGGEGVEAAKRLEAILDDAEPTDTMRLHSVNVAMLRALLATSAEAERMAEALDGLVEIIDKAGLLNLSNGVQLGPTVWYVRASDRLEVARAALASTGREG